MQYKVISEPSQYLLSQEVTKLLNNKWLLVGGVSVANQGLSLTFTQALVLYEDV